MGEVATSLGLDWAKFLAQVLIFLIVFFILKQKAFGPIQAMLKKRQERIEQGEENLKKIQEDLAAAEAKADEIVSKANADAERMIDEARENATALLERKTQEAVNEANQIIAKAHEASEMEKERVMTDLKREFGRMVVDATTKVTGKVLTPEDQNTINQETAGQIAL